VSARVPVSFVRYLWSRRCFPETRHVRDAHASCQGREVGGSASGQPLLRAHGTRRVATIRGSKTRAMVRFCLTTFGAYVTIAPSNEHQTSIGQTLSPIETSPARSRLICSTLTRIVHHDRLASPVALPGSISLSREPIDRVPRNPATSIGLTFKPMSSQPHGRLT
jgi:hypothetical protein